MAVLSRAAHDTMGNIEGFQATWTAMEYRNIGKLPVSSSEMGDHYLDAGREFLQNWQELSDMFVPGPTD